VLDLLLRQKDLRVTSADTEIHAAAAESNEARALHMQRGDVVLHFKSSLFSMDGSIIDVSRSYFLPGYFRFHVIRRVEPGRTSN
jgi:GntR family transcriptional regulator